MFGLVWIRSKTDGVGKGNIATSFPLLRNAARNNQAIGEFEAVLERFATFRAHAGQSDQALLKKAQSSMMRCEVTKWEALTLKGLAATAANPGGRASLALKTMSKFAQKGLLPEMVFAGLWQGLQNLVKK